VLGLSPDWNLIHIILPIGISFYTFQTMSYTIDIYRKIIEPTTHFLDFALFVSFFPQLVAGPIERASSLLPQVLSPRIIDQATAKRGLYLILWGLFKKVYIADNCAKLVDMTFSANGFSNGFEVLLGVYAFAFQIYADFSAYSDIARGVAKTLGFNLMLNFNLPYFATNPSDLWRRWHISLSSWLRDYLYIFALGGNRGGAYETYRNLSLTMLLGGLWHGAAWTFIFWGAYHGLLLVGHRLLSPLLSLIKPESSLSKSVWFWTRIFIMFHLVCISWLLFRAQSMSQILEMTKAFLFDFRVNQAGLLYLGELFQYIWILVIVQFLQFKTDDHFIMMKQPTAVRVAFLTLLVYLLAVHGTTAESFIYFQF
jgi:D-alanyl-lipoteichoic acid acyltransferase DltB (MBOAT superfamily)